MKRNSLYSLLAASAAMLPLSASAQNYTLTNVGRLPGASGAYPTAMNADDPTDVKIVGNTPGGGHPFFWSMKTGAIKDAGTLNGAVGGQLFHVNRRGEAVGESGEHPAYWSLARLI